MTIRRAAFAAILLGYLGVVLVLTLSPTSGRAVTPNLVPFAGIVHSFETGGIGYGAAQAAGNLLLLVPLGLLAPWVARGVGWAEVGAAALGFSATIEVGQWWLGMGRMADVDDVWLNVAGAIIGYVAVRPWLRRG